jgi:hypothetical protein
MTQSLYAKPSWNTVMTCEEAADALMKVKARQNQTAIVGIREWIFRYIREWIFRVQLDRHAAFIVLPVTNATDSNEHEYPSLY